MGQSMLFENKSPLENPYNLTSFHVSLIALEIIQNFGFFYPTLENPDILVSFRVPFTVFEINQNFDFFFNFENSFFP